MSAWACLQGSPNCGPDVGHSACEIAFLRRELSEARRDAERWRAFGESGSLTYIREPLFNAKTGEQRTGVARWLIYWDGPDRALFQDAIDAAMQLPEEKNFIIEVTTLREEHKPTNDSLSKKENVK